MKGDLTLAADTAKEKGATHLMRAPCDPRSRPADFSPMRQPKA